MNEPRQMELFPELVKPVEREEAVIRDPLENLHRWKNQAFMATWKFHNGGLFEHEYFNKPTTFLRGYPDGDDRGRWLTFEAPAQLRSKFKQVERDAFVRLTFLGKSGTGQFAPYDFEVAVLRAPGVPF
jgi:hypothetical protein